MTFHRDPGALLFLTPALELSEELVGPWFWDSSKESAPKGLTRVRSITAGLMSVAASWPGYPNFPGPSPRILAPQRTEQLLKFLEPQIPQPIHERVRDRRGRHTSLFSPRAPIENPCDRGQQYVAPIEVRRPFVEVRQTEEDRRND